MVIWERPDSSLDTQIQALLNAGQNVVKYIGPWEQPRPEAPKADNVRLNMLTPSGLHFGYGGFKTLSEDPMGNAIITPATELLQGLNSKKSKEVIVRQVDDMKEANRLRNQRAVCLFFMQNSL